MTPIVFLLYSLSLAEAPGPNAPPAECTGDYTISWSDSGTLREVQGRRLTMTFEPPPGRIRYILTKAL